MLTHTLSFFYYLLDNSLLFIKILAKLKIFPPETEATYELLKNNFSFYKNILTFLKNSIFVIVRLFKQHDLIRILKEMPGGKVQFYHESYDVCHALTRQKSKMRMEVIDLLLSCLRMLMLLKKLKYFRLHHLLHPIFISGCGLINAFVSFMIQLVKERKSLTKGKDEVLSRLEYIRRWRCRCPRTTAISRRGPVSTSRSITTRA